MLNKLKFNNLVVSYILAQFHNKIIATFRLTKCSNQFSLLPLSHANTFPSDSRILDTLLSVGKGTSPPEIGALV